MKNAETKQSHKTPVMRIPRIMKYEIFRIQRIKFGNRPNQETNIEFQQVVLDDFAENSFPSEAKAKIGIEKSGQTLRNQELIILPVISVDYQGNVQD